MSRFPKQLSTKTGEAQFALLDAEEVGHVTLASFSAIIAITSACKLPPPAWGGEPHPKLGCRFVRPGTYTDGVIKDL